MWRKNPIPRGSWEWPNSGNSFDPVCDESDECKGYSDLKAKQSRGACRCSGTSTRYEPYPSRQPIDCHSPGLGVLGRPVLVQNLEVVDVLRVPKVKPGRYVLQWRWDAERSDQIWSNCADVNIV